MQKGDAEMSLSHLHKLALVEHVSSLLRIIQWQRLYLPYYYIAIECVFKKPYFFLLSFFDEFKFKIVIPYIFALHKFKNVVIE